MSPAFIKGITENLPNAAVTFDKFHAVKIINDAVDQVRLVRDHPTEYRIHALGSSFRRRNQIRRVEFTLLSF